MKKINISTLSILLIQELFESAKSFGLSKADLFVLTIKGEIEELTYNYYIACVIGESVNLRDYVRDVKEKIRHGLLFTTEDFSFTT